MSEEGAVVEEMMWVESVFCRDFTNKPSRFQLISRFIFFSFQRGGWVWERLPCFPPPSKAKCHFQASVARRYLTWLCLSQRRRAIRRRKVKARLHVRVSSCFPPCLLSAIKAAAGWRSVFFGSSPSQMCPVGEATEQWWTCRDIQTPWRDRTAVWGIRRCSYSEGVWEACRINIFIIFILFSLQSFYLF